jgi:DNA-binding MurR/RpiR family transcriptional regulator
VPTVESSLPHAPAGLPLSVEQFDRLSPNHQRLAQFVADHPSFVAFASASEIGRSVDMSTATVVRFAQALGYPGYPQFQEVIRSAYLRTLRPLESLDDLPREHRDVFDNQVHQDISNLRRSLHLLKVDRPTLIDLAKRLASAAGVVVAASGADSAVAVLLGYYLRLLGCWATTELRSGSDFVETIAPLGNIDCLIVIEFGITEGGFANAVSWASAKGVFTAVITDSAYSASARVADMTLVQATEGISSIRSLVGPISVVQGLVELMLQNSSAEERARFRDALNGAPQLG